MIVSGHISIRKGGLKSSSLLKHKRAKGSPSKKKASWLKKDACSRLQGVVVAEGKDEVGVDVGE
jgi:hypothetical protein